MVWCVMCSVCSVLYVTCFFYEYSKRSTVLEYRFVPIASCYHSARCYLSSYCTCTGLIEKVVVDYENKRLQKEQHEQIESLKIVQV